MEWGLTYKISGLAVTCGYFCGRPWRWDPIRNQVVDIQTKWEFVRWILGVIVITILKVATMTLVVCDLTQGRIIWTNSLHISNVILSIIYVWSIVFDIHTIYRRRELRIFLNTQLSYFEAFIQKYSRTDIKPKPNLTPTFLAILIITLVLLPFGCIVLYIVRCDLHVLGMILPTCSQNEGNIVGLLKSFGLFCVMAIVLFLFILHNVSTTFIYLVIATPWGFMALDIFKELIWVTPELAATSSSLKTFKEMIFNYRCIQLIVIIAHKSFLDFIAPFILIITMFLNIGILYSLIRFRMDLVQFVVTLVFELILVSLYALIYGRLAILGEVSKSIQDTWKGLCDNKHRQVRLKSLAPVRIQIGSFCFLERQTVILICVIIVGRTVDLLLLS